jgi:hypothetical protein
MGRQVRLPANTQAANQVPATAGLQVRLLQGALVQADNELV